MKKILAVLIIPLLFAHGVFAQEIFKDYVLSGIVQYDFTSGITNEPYRLSIALPFGYSAADTTHYPVLYVLDSDPNLPLAALIQWNMTYDGEVPNMILVGVGYQAKNFMETVPYRTLDYTPSSDVKADSEMTLHHHVRMVSGGAAKFLRVLTDEIRPLIRQRYRTTTDEGLAGHSFGGLFTAYVLMNQPELFDRYLISSPSLDWGSAEIKKEEAKFYQAGHRVLSARVFVSAGSSEPDSMVPDVEQWVATLDSRKYKGLQITEKIFEGETHLSVIPFSISRGLRALYHN